MSNKAEVVKARSPYRRFGSTGHIIRMVMEIVSGYYGISEKDLISKKRYGHLVEARHMICYLLKGRASLQTIATHLGRENHTTIISSLKKMERILSYEESSINDYNILKKAINEKLEKYDTNL